MSTNYGRSINIWDKYEYFIYYIDIFALFTATIQFYFFDKRESDLKNKITNILGKQIANNFFILIFLNFPQIAAWQYMRKNNILAPELLESDKLFQYIGIDFIVLSVIAFLVPLVLALSKEKFKNA